MRLFLIPLVLLAGCVKELPPQSTAPLPIWKGPPLTIAEYDAYYNDQSPTVCDGCDVFERIRLKLVGDCRRSARADVEAARKAADYRAELNKIRARKACPP